MDPPTAKQARVQLLKEGRVAEKGYLVVLGVEASDVEMLACFQTGDLNCFVNTSPIVLLAARQSARRARRSDGERACQPSFRSQGLYDWAGFGGDAGLPAPFLV